MLNFISYKHRFQKNYFKPLSTASLTSSTLKDKVAITAMPIGVEKKQKGHVTR